MAKKRKKKEVEEVEDVIDELDDTYDRGIGRRFLRSAIAFGSALAMVVSYSAWHSVFWAIVHGLLSWIYIVYYLLTYTHIF